ncbi:MAG: hypothetical protein EZS28_056651, partial [Streblomastix strix]
MIVNNNIFQFCNATAINSRTAGIYVSGETQYLFSAYSFWNNTFLGNIKSGLVQRGVDAFVNMVLRIEPSPQIVKQAFDNCKSQQYESVFYNFRVFNDNETVEGDIDFPGPEKINFYVQSVSDTPSIGLLSDQPARTV